MVFILAVIYVVFISLGLPDSLFGAAWPVVHKDFGIEESFASLYGIITGFCVSGVRYVDNCNIYQIMMYFCGYKNHRM